MLIGKITKFFFSYAFSLKVMTVITYRFYVSGKAEVIKILTFYTYLFNLLFH